VNTGAGLAAISLVVVATVLIGVYGLRVSRTTSDFMVASRSVPPALNASAICGEYLSAASFLGVAGLVLLNGIDALWFPIGYTAGYLVLLVLVAARRLADEHEVRVGVPRPEDDLRPGLRELGAARARARDEIDLLERLAAILGALRRGHRRPMLSRVRRVLPFVTRPSPSGADHDHDAAPGATPPQRT